MADNSMNRRSSDNSINKGLILSLGVALLVQAAGFIWWMSGLNSEVQRLASIQSDTMRIAIPALEAEAQKCGIAIHNNVAAIKELQEHDVAISGLDVLGFKVDQLREEIRTLREVDREIMIQHERIFEWMANNSGSRGSGGSGAYN
jgi:multidrug resistance efflux pump